MTLGPSQRRSECNVRQFMADKRELDCTNLTYMSQCAIDQTRQHDMTIWILIWGFISDMALGCSQYNLRQICLCAYAPYH
jgi:hypothetical protein